MLARAGDRHRYESVAREEYDAIRAEVEAGTYEYRVEDGTFDCADYEAWLTEIGEPAEKLDPRKHVGAGLMLEVIDGGLRTTVQDMGRRGGQALGIPPSGAQDGFALRIGNLLVGNPPGGPLLIRGDPGAAGLEMTLGRLKLRALRDHVLALTGADTGRNRGRRGSALLDELRPARGPDARLRARAERRAGLPRGSRRRRRAALPGQPRHPCQRRLRRAGRAPARVRTTACLWARRRQRRRNSRGVGCGRTSFQATRRPCRCARWRGPRSITSPPTASRPSTPPTGSSTPRRTGRECASSGPELSFRPGRPHYLIEDAGKDPSNIVIDPGAPVGTVQVPSGVEPIVLCVDSPSIGGYARIAIVISTDMARIGQVRPFEETRFVRISHEEAVAVLAAQEEQIADPDTII